MGETWSRDTEGGTLGRGEEGIRRGAPGEETESASGGSSAPWRDLGLRDEEYERIVQLLGRHPNRVELGMFAALWSEHCAYKHSRPLLERLPRESDRLLLGAGENAGVVAVGPYGVAFRVESHNHPTAVEPYHGAATGAGGIMRDILAVGARPVAVMGALRFGDPADKKAHRLFTGAVAGLVDYGNEAGVPPVGAHVAFEPCYRDNPLVNVLGVGILPKERLTRARASGVGNALMLVGARTGRDGVLGASFASEELPAADGESGPVQIGNPESARRLIAACLEILEQPGVVGVQDMGAAGITSSVAETASSAGSGADIDVTRVPLREEGMTPYEILLSESQERMLFVVERGREEAVEAVCRRWGLEAAVLGRVTDDGFFTVREGETVVARVPVRALTEEAPRYVTPSRRPAYLDQVPRFDPERVPEPGDWAAAFHGVLASPNVADGGWVYRRFQAPSGVEVASAPGDAGVVLRLPDAHGAIVLALAGSGRYCWLDPYVGAAHGVAEAARAVACTGAQPLALTNGLNLGNPEKPEVYWQMERVVDGIAAACRALDIPVSGGNVSLYNETAGEPVYPTPIIGVLGVLEGEGRPLPAAWDGEGLVLLLLGDEPAHLGGSAYLTAAGHPLMGPVPPLDLESEGRLHGLLRRLHREGAVQGARSVSVGGLAAALVAMAAPAGIGAEVDLEGAGVRGDVYLFGEGGSRAVVAAAPERQGLVESLVREYGVPCRVLGRTGGKRLRVTDGSATHLDEPLEALVRTWRSGLERRLEAGAASGGEAVGSAPRQDGENR